MDWPGSVIQARFLCRYKRFLADFRLADGSIITAHCANTGSMATCLAFGAPCILTHHPSAKRKLKYSWQAIHLSDGWTGINTALANGLVREAIENGVIKELVGYDRITMEPKLGAASRADLVLERGDQQCIVEVKNVTLWLGDGRAAFPDAVTARGTKHLEELTRLVQTGDRAVLVYCVQRTSANSVLPAADRDPQYARTLLQAERAGVEVLAYRAEMDHGGVALTTPLPVILEPEGIGLRGSD